MQVTNAVKKLNKAGFTVTHSGNHYSAQFGRHIISFYEQGGRTICIRWRTENDHDDVTRDYSAGVFCDNLSQAIKIAR
jgi:hypothetical protein